MYLISVLLPLYDNDRGPLDPDLFGQVASELAGAFGGLTAHTRAPAQGVWQSDQQAPRSEESSRLHPRRDDVVIYEVMAEVIDRAWWST